MLRTSILLGIFALLPLQDARADEDASCAGHTPLPDDVGVVSPGSDLPVEIAGFSGTWSGSWSNRAGTSVVCHGLVVEQLFANGFAQVIYSLGHEKGRLGGLPRYRRYVGRIEEGRLSVKLEDGKTVHYGVSDGKLASAHDNGRRGLLVPLSAPNAMGCRDANLIDLSPRDASRRRLTRDDLLRPAGPGDGLIHTSNYAPGPDAEPPKHSFDGTLHLAAGRIYRTAQGCPARESALRPVSIRFVTAGEDLVPVERQILHPPASGGHQDLILSPGKVWSEPGDGEFSRAAFPFVMVANNSNATHNGLASFLFNDHEISQVWFQVAQETTPWNRYDAWGSMGARYEPVENPSDEVREAYAQEKADALDLLRLEDLERTHGPGLLAQFDGAWGAEHVSASGLLLNGALYARCRTRFGPHPYCRHMRHGVFSVTKSILAAVTLFRLAALYGDEVLDLMVADYLPDAKDRAGWADVTFGHLLSMAAGLGNAHPERQPPMPFADSYITFAAADSDASRIQRALGSYGNLPWGPGEVMRYNSAHTYLLGVAMSQFYRSKAGADADLWAMMREEVFRPIGVHHLAFLRGPNDGLPALSHGAFPTLEDVAKIARLLQSDGRHGDVQLLSSDVVREALFRAGAAGLPTGFDNRFGQGRYHLSFWGAPVTTSDGCDFLLPAMSGYGGNRVIILPNGVSAFRFADGFNDEFEPLIAAGWAVKPQCGPIDETVHDGALSADEALAAIAGSTFYAGDWHIYLAPDGTIFSASAQELWLGRWRVDPAGRYCSRYSTWRTGAESCYSVHHEGKQWLFRATDRWQDLVLLKVAGNPEGY